jgi:hypothetical protein
MKFGKVARLCKAMHNIMIVNDERKNGDIVQWVGVGGGALYPFYGLPYMDEHTAFAVLDVEDKVKPEYTFNEGQGSGYRLEPDGGGRNGAADH